MKNITRSSVQFIFNNVNNMETLPEEQRSMFGEQIAFTVGTFNLYLRPTFYKNVCYIQNLIFL